VDLNALLVRSELCVAWLHKFVDLTAPLSAPFDGGVQPQHRLPLLSEWLSVDERTLLDVSSDGERSGGDSGADCTTAKVIGSLKDGGTSRGGGRGHGSSGYGSSAAFTSHVKMARDRRDAMIKVMWRRDQGRFFDALLLNGTCSAIVPGSASDVTPVSGWSAPLWAGLLGAGGGGRESGSVSSSPSLSLSSSSSSSEQAADRAAALTGLVSSGLLQVGGALTNKHALPPTLVDQEQQQQWDSPNAWAPLQLMLVDGLMHLAVATATPCGEDATTGTVALAAATARNLSVALGEAWLQSNLMGFAATTRKDKNSKGKPSNADGDDGDGGGGGGGGGGMFEKYNAFVPGQRGEGGEYEPQAGFGWTNGVALELISLLHSSPLPPASALPI